MSKLCEIGYIKQVLAAHGFTFSKALGQNFLCAPEVPAEIAAGAGIDSDTCVLEVGPGIGTLSYELCQLAKQVVAIELDKRLPDLLAETMAGKSNFKVIQGDILKVNLEEIIKESFGTSRVVACANLPYYITTPAISTLMESGCFDVVTVMVQREVARRICAEPGTREYGSFTIYVNYYAKPSVILNVPRGSFIPSPNVDSSVVRLDLYKTPPVKVKSPELMFRTVKAGFAQRRKTLLNCLLAGFPQLEKTQIVELLARVGIDPIVRGETLSLDQYAKLSDEIGEYI